MAVTLRVVLDQLGGPQGSPVADAEREIARALVATAPQGCDVTAIVPAGDEDAGGVLDALAGVTRAPLGRGALIAAWQVGIAPGIGGGLIHAPSPVAPLVRHDRVHANDQTVPTFWDLCAWESPDGMARATVAAHRALLRRAERHADAVVVPSHAMAERLGEISRLSGRVRVIPGAAPAGFAAPSDAVGRRRALRVAEGGVVIAGGACGDEALAAGLSAVSAVGGDLPVTILDVSEARAPRVHELAEAAGVPVALTRVLGALETPDRASVLADAAALVDPSGLTVFPWRVVEALALGVPVLTSDTDIHREVVLDGGVCAGPHDLGDALRRIVDGADARQRYAVRAADRGRAFSWRDHAERVWALHAEL